mgnify:CR=1 FL=1
MYIDKPKQYFQNHGTIVGNALSSYAWCMAAELARTNYHAFHLHRMNNVPRDLALYANNVTVPGHPIYD